MTASPAIVHNYVNPTKVLKRAIDHLANGWIVCDVQRCQPQLFAVTLFQVVQLLQLMRAQSPSPCMIAAVYAPMVCIIAKEAAGRRRQLDPGLSHWKISGQLRRSTRVRKDHRCHSGRTLPGFGTRLDLKLLAQVSIDLPKARENRGLLHRGIGVSSHSPMMLEAS